MKNKIILFLVILLSIGFVSLFSLKDNTINNTDSVNFENLTLVAFGDSNTYGYDRTESDKRMDIPYPEGVADELDLASVSNYGVNGSTIAYADDGRHCSTKELLRFTKQADIIIVAVGTNDYYANRPLGDKYSKKTTSIYGALHTGMEYLTTFYPDSLIIYMTPYKCFRENKLYSENNNQGYNLEDVANVIKYKAKQFNIPVIDLFNKSGFEDIMFDSELTDGIHPTQEFTLDVTIPMVSDFIKKKL